MILRFLISMKKAKDGTKRGNPDIHLYSSKDTTAANAERTKLADEYIKSNCGPLLQANEAKISLRKIAMYLNEKGITTRRGKEHTAASVSRMIKRCIKLQNKN